MVALTIFFPDPYMTVPRDICWFETGCLSKGIGDFRNYEDIEIVKKHPRADTSDNLGKGSSSVSRLCLKGLHNVIFLE